MFLTIYIQDVCSKNYKFSLSIVKNSCLRNAFLCSLKIFYAFIWLTYMYVPKPSWNDSLFYKMNTNCYTILTSINGKLHQTLFYKSLFTIFREPTNHVCFFPPRRAHAFLYNFYTTWICYVSLRKICNFYNPIKCIYVV